ncbi:unnamed protein product [Cuscuta epithymum]|uniref:Protein OVEREXPRESSOR OF CATIONIC PEROXIDASE 3 n=1 Tax=Cuscuta epithymum TaxID=186058 RepID=A0AAV0G9M9_9ASTE|nr:unnamed protein product [Cuscuta epithymum]CAH9144684.1 unnamed protein product [Cuscuta epithymum]
MAASTSLHISITLRCSHINGFSVYQPCSRTNLPSPRHRSSSVLTFSRRRSDHHGLAAAPSNKKKQKRSLAQRDKTDDDLGEDAVETLFLQLEKDLENDDLSMDDVDSEITEEDLANLERELEEALKGDNLSGDVESILDEENQEIKHEVDLRLEEGEGEGEEEEEDEEEEEEEEEDKEEYNDDDDDDDVDASVKGYEDNEYESPVQLKNWQLKRLAYALKNGRRKTSIKNLAADLCLDRAVVLKLLRDPSPHLLMLSATLPDKPIPIISEPPSIPLEKTEDFAKEETTEELPVHVMQQNWSAKKKIKKKQLGTLEQVYGRSKRPTNQNQFLRSLYPPAFKICF